MDRRFFVLTTTGERGPFTVDDLKREWQAGLVQRSDHLRTALGKSAGTVGELIGPGTPARSSGRMSVPNLASSARQPSATNLRPVSEIRRATNDGNRAGGKNGKNSSSSRNDLRSNRASVEGNATRLLALYMGLGLLALAAGAWWLVRA